MAESHPVKVINSSNFMVVTLTNGKLLTSERGDICVQDKSDGTIYFVSPTKEIAEEFNLSLDAVVSSFTEEQTGAPDASCSSTSNTSITVGKRPKWPKEAIHLLIDLRIKYDKDFKLTTVKNEVLWKRIAEALDAKGFAVSSTQCNDKWRYLKARYTTKKDNMGNKGSGESPVDCPFFEELDNFLGKRHNIEPIAIASSIDGDTIADVQTEETLEENKQKRRKTDSALVAQVKARKTGTEVILDEMKNSNRLREENRERRHQEALNVRNRAIDVFSAKMDMIFHQNMKK